MEPLRELDQIRSELDRLHDRTTTTKVDVTALQANTEQRFEHILACLEAMKADMQSLNTAVAGLQTLATEGQTSLKTLLWLGGAIAGISAFLIMLYNLLPK